MKSYATPELAMKARIAELEREITARNNAINHTADLFRKNKDRSQVIRLLRERIEVERNALGLE